MPRDHIQVTGHSPASPEAVWAVASDFCGAWHPALSSIRAERDARGALVRVFTVHGDDATYRERLTWFSDSDRTLGYTHLAGIAGVDAYDARIAVSPADGGGSTIGWTATVQAPSPRLEAICKGTKAIFETGIAALSGRHGQHGRAAPTTWAKPASVAGEEIVVDGSPRIVLTATPPRNGPLCLFLHGIGGAGWNWRHQLGAAGIVMRAAAMDLRGYGGSALGPRQSTVDDYCDDILRAARSLGADRMVLVGLSYGSWIATSFAMRHPEMLAGLVLSGGCTGMSEAGPEERESFRASREAPLNAGRTPADFAPAVAEVLAGRNAGDEVRRRMVESMAAIPAATYRDALVCFTDPHERFDFSRLTMPVLMMTGQYDRLAPPAEIRGVAERILKQAANPDVRYETIAGAGHVCNLEQPESYSRILVEFLGKLP